MLDFRFWSLIVSLARIRFWLLIKQKLGWISIVLGAGLVFLSLITAQVSYVSAARIFWDFSLGAIFIMQIGLAIYFGTQTFADEKQRRTLHLLLSSGVSRPAWLLGTALGIWLGLGAMLVFWFALSCLVSWLVFGWLPFTMAFQSIFLLAVETFVVLQMGFLLSFVLRPLLALTAVAVLVLFLHSVTSVQQIFADPNVGRFIDDPGLSFVLLTSRLLPPLEWFDLKFFVGYESQVSWGLVASMTTLGALWSLVLFGFSWLRFEKMDL